MFDTKMFDEISKRLSENKLTNVWLMARLAEVGFKVDKVSFSRWLHGVQLGSRAVECKAICEKILDTYDKFMKEVVI